MLFVGSRGSRFVELSKATRMREMSVNPANRNMPRGEVFNRAGEDHRMKRSVDGGLAS
jgi:hypothetical protein